MSTPQSGPSRLSRLCQQAFLPLLGLRKLSKILPGGHHAEATSRQDSSGTSNAYEESTPPTSFSVIDDDEEHGDKSIASARDQSSSEPLKLWKGKGKVKEPWCLVDRLYNLELGESSRQPAKITKTSRDWSQSREEHEAVLELSKEGSASEMKSRWTSPRRGPTPPPPISPKSMKPVVWERGRLTLSAAVRDSKTMVEQLQCTRNSFKQAVSKYFRLLFADVKVLLKALDRLAASIDELRSQLDMVGSTMLDEIELLDIHLGALLQEGDRILRAMTRGSSRTGPLTGRSKSMRKNMIKDDLGPQMLELAENVNILKGRVDSITQIIVAKREGTGDSTS